MLRSLVTFFGLVVLLAVPLQAQRLQEGFFMTVGGGLVAFDNGAFSHRLQSYVPSGHDGEGLVYSTPHFPTNGFTIDGSIGILVGGDVIVGLCGQSLTFKPIKAITSPGFARDEYVLSGRGGGVEIALPVVNEGGVVVSPFVEGGYYGYSLDYTNRQVDSLPFFEGVPVAPGGTTTYRGSAPRIGLGVSMTAYLRESADAGSFCPVLRARLSWGTMLSRPRWTEPDGSEVKNGGLTPAYNGVALTVQVGVGK